MLLKLVDLLITNFTDYLIVSDFARKTGDFYSLSITDIKVIALNYTFERELNKGVSHLRTEPNTKVS